MTHVVAILALALGCAAWFAVQTLARRHGHTPAEGSCGMCGRKAGEDGAGTCLRGERCERSHDHDHDHDHGDASHG